MKRNGISKILAASLACVMLVSSAGVQPVSVTAVIADTGEYLGNPGSTAAIATASTTVYVPDDYPTIQAAVDAASSDATIIVRAGTYIENIDVNKGDLTIESESGADVTIVQAANSNDHVFHVNNVNGVRISGFTVKGATAQTKGGISLDGANSCEIVNNVVSQNWVGVGLYMARDNTIRQNTFSNNTYGGGISEDESGTCAVAEAVYGAGVTAEPEETLNSLRVLRDQELNPAYVDSYYEYSPDMARILISDPGLMLRAAKLISKYMPAVKHVLGQGGEDLEITEQGAQEMASFLRDLRGAAADRQPILGAARSTKLLGLLDEFEDQITASEGKMFSEAFLDSVYCAGSTQSTGLTAASGANNLIYLNNFIDNTTNAQVQQSANTWNSVQKISYIYEGNLFEGFLGNYWGSSYTGSDAYGDGVGDTAYVIDGANIDDYPLMDPFKSYLTGPRRPRNIMPKSGERWGPSLVLHASAFAHPITEAKHAASQWQISRTEDAFYFDLALDTGSITGEDLEWFISTEGILEPDTWYFWRVRYQDNLGLWSEWSKPTSFLTRPPEDNALWDWPSWYELVNPGETFTITFSAENWGELTWTPEYQLVLVEGDPPDANDTVAVAIDGDVPPGGYWEKTVEFAARDIAGTYHSVWKLKNPDGQFFGGTKELSIRVIGIDWRLERSITKLISSSREAMGNISVAMEDVAGAGDFFAKEVNKGHLPAILKLVLTGFGIGWDISALATDLSGVMDVWDKVFSFSSPVVSSLTPEGVGMVLADNRDRMDTGAYMYPTITSTNGSDWLQVLAEDSIESGPKSYAAAYFDTPLDELDNGNIVYSDPDSGTVLYGSRAEVFWKMVLSKEGRLANIVQPILADIVQDHQSELDESQLRRAFMAFTAAEQLEWVDDLESRAQAAQVLAQRVEHDSDILPAMREYVDQPWWKKWGWKLATNLGLAAAIYFCDGPAWVVVGLKAAKFALSAHSIYEVFQELLGFDDKENLSLQAVTTMSAAPVEVRRIYSNAHLEPLLQQVRESDDPDPQHIVGEVGLEDHFGVEEKEVCWGGLWDCYVASLSRVWVRNLGDHDATFYLIAFYEGEFPKVTANTLSEKVVDVPAGQKMIVEIVHNLEQGKEAGQPVHGSTIRIVALGVNPTGVFFVGEVEHEWYPVWECVTTSGVLQADDSLVGNAASEVVIEDPVDVFITPSPQNLNYHWQLWVTNPLEEELTAIVEQGLLTTTSVQDAGGARIQDDVLVWELALQPGDLQTREFTFTYEGDPGEDIALPDTEVTFCNASQEVVLDLVHSVPTLTPLLPILTEADLPWQVLPGESIVVALNLTRPGEDGTTSGLVIATLADLAGEPLYEGSTEFSVTAGEVQNVELGLPPVAEMGTYRLDVFVQHGGVTREVSTSHLRVGAPGPSVTMVTEPGDVAPIGGTLTYNVTVQNTVGMPLPDLDVEAILPDPVQIISGSISHGGMPDGVDPCRVWWILEDGLDAEESVCLTVAVNVTAEALGDRDVEMLTAHARVTSNVTVDSLSPAATIFVTQAPEPLVGEVCGQVVLEGREEHGGAQVCVGSHMTSTDLEGRFSLEVPAGDYEVRVTRRGFLSSVTPEIEVAAGETLELDTIYLSAGEVTQELPPGVVRQYYEATLEASGGTAPYIWGVVAGHLPDGLEIDTETGVISGIPTEAETFPFTIQVSDDEGLTITGVLTIIIAVIPGDANRDDVVNVLDMILIAQHWGETGSSGWIPEDVTEDGVINVLDMITVGQHWTG